MIAIAPPVVSAHFFAIGSPLDSFGVTSWQELAPNGPAAAVPSVAGATSRAVSDSVLAWRARYYAFRNARGRIVAGDRAAADAIIAGPHGEYVRGRFAELARTDARFTLASVATSTTLAPDAVDVVAIAAEKLPAGVTLSRNDAREGLEIRFADKPSEPVRAALKAAGWRWSHASVCWYHRANVATLARLRPLCASLAELLADAPATAAPRARVDAPEQSSGDRAAAIALRDYFADVATRFAAMAERLEVPSSQYYTPKRGRQWAQKSHDASNTRRAEAAATALANAWGYVADGADASMIPPALRDKFTMRALCTRTATRGKSDSYYHYAETFKPADESPAAVLLREFVAMRTDGAAALARQKAGELADALYKLRGLEIPGFFPTPAALAARVVHTANIIPGMSLLEPSAGIGDLAEAARNAGGDVTVCEILEPAADVLRLKGFGDKLHRGDFLAMTPHDVGTFGRVVMNPPFESGAAARHVLHAVQFLTPAGRLVAVVPGNFAATLEDPRRGAAGELADLLASDAVDSWRISAPIVDAFAGAGTFRTTGVSVCILDVIKAGPRAGDVTPEQSSPTPDVELIAPDGPALELPAAAPVEMPTTIGGVIVRPSNLRKALQTVLAAIPIPKRGDDVTTKRVRLWTVGDVLRVGALDYSGLPTVDVAGVQVDRPLAAGVVGGKVLQEIFALSNDNAMSVSLDSAGLLHIRGSDSHYKLTTVAIPDTLAATVAPVDDASHWLTVAAGDLAEALRLVEFACAKVRTRYVFDAIAFDFTPNACEVVATDGRRVMAVPLAAIVHDVAAGSVAIDIQSAKALRRALGNVGKAEKVHLCVGEPSAELQNARAVSAIGPALEWRGRSADGRFPEWREVVPSDPTSPRYRFDVAELAAVVKRAATGTSEDNKGVAFEFDVGGRGRVQLSSRNPESGETVAFCHAFDAAGEPFGQRIGFNPAFIGDALRTVKRGNVTLALTAPNRPGLLTFDNGARYILMPVNLQ